jgi:hypothetical protein
MKLICKQMHSNGLAPVKPVIGIFSTPETRPATWQFKTQTSNLHCLLRHDVLVSRFPYPRRNESPHENKWIGDSLPWPCDMQQRRGGHEQNDPEHLARFPSCRAGGGTHSIVMMMMMMMVWWLVFLDLSWWPQLLLRLLAVSDVICLVSFSLLLVFFIPPLCSCYLVVLWLVMT